MVQSAWKSSLLASQTMSCRQHRVDWMITHLKWQVSRFGNLITGFMWNVAVNVNHTVSLLQCFICNMMWTPMWPQHNNALLDWMHKAWTTPSKMDIAVCNFHQHWYWHHGALMPPANCGVSHDVDCATWNQNLFLKIISLTQFCNFNQGRRQHLMLQRNACNIHAFLWWHGLWVRCCVFFFNELQAIAAKDFVYWFNTKAFGKCPKTIWSKVVLTACCTTTSLCLGPTDTQIVMKSRTQEIQWCLARQQKSLIMSTNLRHNGKVHHFKPLPLWKNHWWWSRCISVTSATAWCSQNVLQWANGTWSVKRCPIVIHSISVPMNHWLWWKLHHLCCRLFVRLFSIDSPFKGQTFESNVCSQTTVPASDEGLEHQIMTFLVRASCQSSFLTPGITKSPTANGWDPLLVFVLKVGMMMPLVNHFHLSAAVQGITSSVSALMHNVVQCACVEATNSHLSNTTKQLLTMSDHATLLNDCLVRHKGWHSFECCICPSTSPYCASRQCRLMWNCSKCDGKKPIDCAKRLKRLHAQSKHFATTNYVWQPQHWQNSCS